MGAVFYLYKRTMINRIKYSLKKPVTYIWLFFILIYALAVPYSIKVMVEDFHLDSPMGMVIAMSFLAFLLLPSNLVAYAKRKGLVLLPSDVHFMFPSPLKPKYVLIYAHLKGIPINLLMGIIGVIICGMVFGISPLQLFLFFVFATVMENIMEACMMLIMYGNERLTERGRKITEYLAYALILVVLLIGLFSIYKNGLSMDTVVQFVSSDVLKMVPFIGWYISVIHLIVLGPTLMTVIGSVAYLVAFIVLLCMAVKMKCTGAFYEDAMTFAEDYAELRNKQKQGSTEIRIGKKAKLKQANVAYKGTGAKALFYRQLLEYKKQKFFIFEGQSLIALVIAAAIVFMRFIEVDFEEATPFIIPGFMAYIIFLMANFSGKWSKELKYHYTYLIPDSAFKKLFYATLMQLLTAALNGAIIAIPAGIALGYDPVIIIMCILVYVVLSEAKLYSVAVTEFIGGTALGPVAKQVVQMLILGFAITAAIGGAIAGFLMGGELVAYVLMLICTQLVSGILMIIASLNFEKMEALQ